MKRNGCLGDGGLWFQDSMGQSFNSMSPERRSGIPGILATGNCDEFDFEKSRTGNEWPGL